MLTFRFEAISWIADGIRGKVDETGGLLIGRDQQVLEAQPMVNIASNPSREFAVGVGGLDLALTYAEQRGLGLLGTFHSHPQAPAVMSHADARLAKQTGPLLLVGPHACWEWRLWDPAAGGEVQFAIAPPRS